MRSNSNNGGSHNLKKSFNMSYSTNSYSTPTQHSQQTSRPTFTSRYTPAAAPPQEPAPPAASSAASSDILDEKTKMELLQSSERYKDTRVKTSVYFSYYLFHLIALFSIGCHIDQGSQF